MVKVKIKNLFAQMLVILFLPSTIWAADVDLVCSDFPPFVLWQEKKHDGMFIKIIDSVAQQTSLKVKIEMLPWKRAQHKVETATSNTPMCIFPLMRSSEREAKFKWASLFYSDDASFLALRKRQFNWQTIDDAKKSRIGVVRSSPLLEDLIKKEFPKLDIVNDVITNARKLHFGRIDAWFVPELVGRYTYKSVNFDVNEVVTALKVAKMDFYVACSKQTPDEFIKKWQDGFLQIQKNGRYKQIIEEYRL